MNIRNIGYSPLWNISNESESTAANEMIVILWMRPLLRHLQQ